MKKFTLVLFLFISIISQAQRFEKNYGGTGSDNGIDIATLSDGSIISVGTSNSYGAGGNDIMVVKTNSSGVLLWINYLGGSSDDQGRSVAIGSNDEIYISGITTSSGAGAVDIYLAKLNASGSILWTKTLGGSASDYVNDMLFKNNKLFLIGSTLSSGAGGEDIYFVSTDTSGTIVNSKTLGGTAADFANCIATTNDGNLILGGRSASFTGLNVYVAKINYVGDTLWTKKFNLNSNTGQAGNVNIAAKGITQLSDQQYLITGFGYKYNGGYGNMFHLRLDATGNQVYSLWSSSLSDAGADVISGTNGGYLLLRSYCNFGCSMYLDKYDKNGVQVWTKNLQYGGGNSYVTFSSPSKLFKLTASRILLTGSTYLVNGTADVYIARLDSNGIAYTTTAPAIAASGPTSFCAGGSVVLSVPAGYSTYQWVTTGSNYTSYLTGNSNTYTVTVSGQYYCVMTNANGITKTSLLNVTVTNPPSTNITASGATSYCKAAGGLLTLTVPTAMNSYQWNLNGNPISGANIYSHTPASSGVYTVTMSNACATLTTNPITVKDTLTPSSVINCPSGNCYEVVGGCFQGSQGSLQVSSAGTGATYQWFRNNVLYTSGSNYLSAGYPSGSYTCKITNACGTSTSAPYIVSTYSSSNIITAYGPYSGCGVGSSVGLEAPYPGSSYYQWHLNGSPIAGANLSQYTATSSGTYTVEYYNLDCFFNIFSDPIVVTLNTIANPTLSANSGTSACAGILPLTVSATGVGYTYNWYRDYVNLGTYTTPTFNATSTGRYYCVVYNPACGYGTTNYVYLNIGNPIVTTSNNNVSICQGSSSVLSITSSFPLYTYQWKLNGTNINGATGPVYTANQAGTFTCAVTNACSTIVSSPINVTVIPTPTPSISYSGNSIVCSSQTKILSTTLNTGNTYTWYRGTTNVGGGLNVNTYNATQATSYTVRESTPQGCTALSPAVVFTAGTNPVALIRSVGYPQICSGNSLLLKGASNVGATYQWYKNNVVIAGAVDSSYSVTTNGMYNYIVANSCSTISSSSIQVAVKAKPTATISAVGSTTFCNGDSVVLQANVVASSSYGWIKGVNFINGASSSSYSAKQAGSYKVQITNQFGCSKQSNSIAVTVPCKEGDGFMSNGITNVNVYPNPSNGNVFVEIENTNENIEFSLELFDAQGNLIEAEIQSDQNNLLKLSNLSSGIYLLKLVSSEETILKKIIVAN
jgi:hypothetical protein